METEKLNIVHVPDPILEKELQQVEEVTHEIERLAHHMTTCMRSNSGIGLAANQVNKDLKIAVIDPALFGDSNQVFCMINPSITRVLGSEEMTEGCLSIPGASYKVKRPWQITVTFTNISGKKQTMALTGFKARVVMHEVDHLNGLTIADRGKLIKEADNAESETTS